jgi:hypothetical protein
LDNERSLASEYDSDVTENATKRALEAGFAIIDRPKQTDASMNNRLLMLFAALPLALCACASTGAADGAPAGGTITLAPRQQIPLQGNATLTYDSFSDSRCPPEVKCIWAGELVYRFTLVTPKASESFALGSAKPAYVSKALGGARIAIDMSRLPPAPQAGAAPQAHPVTLTVSRQ